MRGDNLNDYIEMHSREMKKKKENLIPSETVFSSSSNLSERKKMLDELRRQQNEHLLGVLEEEQEREHLRQNKIRIIMDAGEKVLSMSCIFLV